MGVVVIVCWKVGFLVGCFLFIVLFLFLLIGFNWFKFFFVWLMIDVVGGEGGV